MTQAAQKNRPDLFQVMAEQCDQCLMTKNRVVPGRTASEIIKTCKSDGTHFICHKASIAGGLNVCCRGFYDQVPTTVIHVAQALDRVVFVEVPDA